MDTGMEEIVDTGIVIHFGPGWIFLWAAIFLFVYFTVIFVIAHKIRNNAIVDMAWGPGFVLVALLSFFLAGKYTPAGMLVTGLVSLWGLRLFYHIARRNWGKPEDFRYREMRERWGDKRPALKAWTRVFLLQGLLMYVISLSVLIVNMADHGGFSALVMAGLVIWLIGFFFEAVGDYQLKVFITAPINRGKLMTSGLWKYTRHPNYFGEATMWWGIFIIALSVPFGFLSVVSPVLITYLLLYVSGVPLLEEKFAKRADFREYARITPKFVPWFPKKSR